MSYDHQAQCALSSTVMTVGSPHSQKGRGADQLGLRGGARRAAHGPQGLGLAS